jgi:hypothetical protein
MRTLLAFLVFACATALGAQPAGKFPPVSLINTQVIPHTTPVINVIGTMRNFAGDLGVRCQFCHIGREGQPLEQFDFASDEKRNKIVARQMMRMLADINRRLDTIPERGRPNVVATCATCHRGVSRPAPLDLIVQDAATTVDADSAVRAYRALRARYYGRGAYDFGESTLNIAAFRTARAGKPDAGLALLKLNDELLSAIVVHVGLRGQHSPHEGRHHRRGDGISRGNPSRLVECRGARSAPRDRTHTIGAFRPSSLPQRMKRVQTPACARLRSASSSAPSYFRSS